MRPLLAAALLTLLLAAPAHADLVLLDTATGEQRTLVSGHRTELLRFTDDGAAVLARSGKRVVSVAVADGATTDQPVLAGADFVGPGGRSIVVGDDAVLVRAPDGRTVARIRAQPFLDEIGVAWSPDASRVAIFDGLAVTVVDTGSGARLLRTRGEAAGALTAQAFAPDGSALLVSPERRLLRLDLATGATRVVHRARLPGADIVLGAWSATDRIAAILTSRIRVIGTPAADLDLPATPYGPTLWSPAGDALAATIATAPDRCSSLRFGVALVVPGEPARTVVPPSGRELRGFAWSPDGTTLAVDLGRDHLAEAERRGRRRPFPERVARDYGMFSRRGNAAMRKIVLRAARSLRAGKGREETLRRMRLDYRRVASRFAEADDTAVGEAVGDELDRWLRAAGFRRVDSREEFSC